jgi:hypothetical protein
MNSPIPLELVLVQFMDAAKAEIDEMNRVLNIEQSDSQFKRRTMYRTVFSVVEAYSSHMKEMAHYFAGCDNNIFTDAEKLALLGRTYVINSSGRIEEQDAKISMKTNIRMAFWAISKAMGNDHLVDFGTAGAERFFQAVKVRDKIIHPNLRRGWDINDAEINLLHQAWAWFSEQMSICSRPGDNIDLTTVGA